MTVREAIEQGAAQIAARWDETPRLDASVILAHSMGITREKLLAAYPDPVPEDALQTYTEGIGRRVSGWPVAYITGHQEFYALDFKVNTDVLVPRHDTEILAEEALRLLSESKGSTPRVLDLCTGSGCIAVSLKYNCPEAEVEASDISPAALEVFRENCRNILGRELRNYNTDLLEGITGPYDIIVSNPPYLTEETTDSMKNGGWPEPRLALEGGCDGLDFIRSIIRSSKTRLKEGGYLLFEADPSQMKCIKEEYENNLFSDIIVKKDLAGRDRVILGKNCYGKS